MFTRETPFKEAIEVFKTKGACGASFVAMDGWKDLSFGEAMEDFLSDKYTNRGWAVFSLLRLDLDRDLRLDFIKKIEDPMMAFQLYLRIKNLSEEEEGALKLKFKGKLPVAEKELEDGIVKRVSKEDIK